MDKEHPHRSDLAEAARMLRLAVRRGDASGVDRAIARLHEVHREENLQRRRTA